jgi:hypothetical protein
MNRVALFFAVVLAGLWLIGCGDPDGRPGYHQVRSPIKEDCRSSQGDGSVCVVGSDDDATCILFHQDDVGRITRLRDDIPRPPAGCLFDGGFVLDAAP